MFYGLITTIVSAYKYESLRPKEGEGVLLFKECGFTERLNSLFNAVLRKSTKTDDKER